MEGSFVGDFTYSSSDNCAGLAFTRSCEESGNLADNRMLDPDAMIESLDRYFVNGIAENYYKIIEMKIKGLRPS